MRFRLQVIVLAFILSAGCHFQTPADLICAPGTSSETCHWPGFDSKLVSDEKVNGAKVYAIAGSEYGRNGPMFIVDFQKVPTGRKLSFTLALRGTSAADSFLIEAVAQKPVHGRDFTWRPKSNSVEQFLSSRH